MHNNSKIIKVMVVDEHQLVIDGLSALFLKEPRISLEAGVLSGTEALEVLRSKQVDVVICDIKLRGVSGIELTKRIKTNYPNIRVLVLTMHNENALILKMIEAGATGYILKEADFTELCNAIYSLGQGCTYLSECVKPVIMNGVYHPDSKIFNMQSNASKLSKREIEVLNLIAQEHSNVQIAKKLFISKRTVEAHRRNIFTKTKSKTIVGLIKYSLENGLIRQMFNVIL